MLSVDANPALIGGLYRLILVSGIAVSVILMVGLLRHRHLPGAKTLFFLLLSVAQALFCFLALSVSTSPEEGFLWARLRFLGVYLSIPLAYLYVMHFVGRPVRRWMMILLLALPLALQVPLWNSDWASTIFFRDWRLIQYGSFSVEETGFTAIASAYRIFAYIPGIFIIIRLIAFIRTHQGLQRQQARWMLGALGIGLLAGVPATFEGNVTGINLTPLGLAFFAIITTWTFRMRLFAMMPIAYETVLRHMRDGVLVLNTDHEIVGNNPAANRLFPQTDLLGQPLKTILPDESFLQQYALLKPGAEADLQAIAGHEQHTHEISISPITTAQGDIHGRIVVLHDIEHRKQAEQALRQSESRLRIITENMTDVVGQSDLMGQFVYVSPSVEQLMGYKPEHWLSLTPEGHLSMVHPDDQTSVISAYQHTIMTGTSGRAEYRQKNAHGQYMWVEAIFDRVSPRSGEPDSLVTTTRDITPRKQTEEALRRNVEDSRHFRDRLQELHHLNLELAAIDDWDTLTRRIVEKGRELLRIDRVALLVEDPATGIFVGTFGTDPQGNTTDERHYRANFWISQQGQLDNLDRGLLFRDETDLYFNDQVVGRGWHAIAYLASDTHPAGLISADNLMSGRPLTPDDRELFRLFAALTGSTLMRQRTLDTLRASEERYRIISELISDYAYSYHVHPDGSMSTEWVTESYSHVTGYDIGEIDQRGTFTLYPPEEQVRVEADVKAVLQGQAVQSDYRIITKQGEERWLHISRYPVWDATRNRVIRFYGVAKDVTEHRLAEKQQIELSLEKERTSILKRFIETASHEFRTPLAIINASSSFMVRLDDSERREAKAQKVEQQVMRITKLLDMLLVMTRLESQSSEMQRAPVDISRMIRNECQSMVKRHGSQPRLEQRLLKMLPLLMGNLNDLSDAFQQVLDNAFRYTPPEGTITITADAEGDQLWLEVRDTGSGITPEALPHIFETFWREDKPHTTPGFGLGLPIAQRVVNMHHGQITVESKVGEGTTVRITLPLQPPTA